ncbi:MAG: hypothetical protein RLZZ324_1315 [Candidatus Parcubacteria bacterium]|jgi:phosphoesterase RecJ-like protein
MAIKDEKKFLDAVSRAEHVLITFRKEWTTDAVATALALARVLAARGKKADIVADGFVVPKMLAFLPGIGEIKGAINQLRKFTIIVDVARTKLDELSYDLKGDKLHINVTPKEGQFKDADVTTLHSDYKYDLVVSLDTPDYAGLGRLFADHAEFFHATPVVNIDHDSSNERHGNINYVDITATSCAEVLYCMLKDGGEHFLDADIATCLMAGIVSKTRSFKTSSVTPRSLDIASALVAAGARRDEVVQNLYRTRTISTLKLWGRALARLKFDPVTRTAWSVLVRQDFAHAGSSEGEAEGVIDELMMNSPDADIVGLLYEGAAGICVLIATEKHGSALGLVASLKPEGDRRTARLCFPSMTIVEAEQAVLTAIHASLGKTPAGGAVAIAAMTAGASGAVAIA